MVQFELSGQNAIFIKLQQEYQTLIFEQSANLTEFILKEFKEPHHPVPVLNEVFSVSGILFDANALLSTPMSRIFKVWDSLSADEKKNRFFLHLSYELAVFVKYNDVQFWNSSASSIFA